MEPALGLGTLIVTRPEKRYYPGQVIAYYKTQASSGKNTLGSKSHSKIDNILSTKISYSIKAEKKSYSDKSSYFYPPFNLIPSLDKTYAIGASSVQSYSSQLIVTHRIISTHQQNGQLLYQTQGDANLQPDMDLVPNTDIVGKVWLAFPLLGYLLLIPHYRLGYLLVIILPAALLLLSFFLDLFSAVFNNASP
jgi:hypothetical protein